MVIVVAGMSALWKPLHDSTVHRPQTFSILSGLSQGERITPEAIINVLVHPSGGLKNIPNHARKILLLNQADTEPLQLVAREIAESLLTSYECVIVGSLNPEGNTENEIEGMQLKGNKIPDIPASQWLISERVFSVHENIAGVILAAGESRRFGGPKLLVDWNGEPLIRDIIRRALDTRLSRIIVVTGAYPEDISGAIAKLPVTRIHNPGWREGQSSSIRIVINELRADINGVIFILADQPHLSIDLIQALLATHSVTLAPIIAPIVDTQRGNPVLFDRSTFSELLTLTGNQGGREVFDQFSIQFIEWNDPNILVDIDTLDDYLRLKNKWDEE
jgi:molybdenum cofactor cytidylyltransferase